MSRTADLPTTDCPPHTFFGDLSAATAVITAAHRGIPVGILVSTLAPVSPAAGVFSFSLSGYSYAWPALEKSTHIGVHLLDPAGCPAEAALAETFARVRVDGFEPGLAWQPGPGGVPLLDGVAHRAVARPTQRIHVGTHVVIVGQVVGVPGRIDAAA
mgnify:CR=1 FL=1